MIEIIKEFISSVARFVQVHDSLLWISGYILVIVIILGIISVGNPDRDD